MKKNALLFELQELDSALDRTRQELDQHKARLGDDALLVPLRQDLEAAQGQLHALQQKGRQLDWEMEDKSTKRKADEKKLYGGSIKNPKELGQLAHEVEHEREALSRLEDQALANMDALDSATAAVEAANRALLEAERDWKAEQAVLEAESASLAGQVADLEARRGAVAARVDQPSLRIYESLRRTRGGLAVAAIEQRACQGCRISLSSSVVQRARAGSELVTCTNCGRILYHP